MFMFIFMFIFILNYDSHGYHIEGWLLSSLLSGALESQCRSGLLLSYPTIHNITSIILISTFTPTT